MPHDPQTQNLQPCQLLSESVLSWELGTSSSGMATIPTCTQSSLQKQRGGKQGMHLAPSFPVEKG